METGTDRERRTTEEETRMQENQALIDVLKNSIWHEEQRIDRAEREIIKLRLELAKLGVELPVSGELYHPEPR